MRIIGKIAIGIFAVLMFTGIDWSDWRDDSMILLIPGILALWWLGSERETGKSDIEKFTGMRITTKDEFDEEDVCPNCDQYLFREINETLRLPNDYSESETNLFTILKVNSPNPIPSSNQNDKSSDSYPTATDSRSSEP